MLNLGGLLGGESDGSRSREWVNRGRAATNSETTAAGAARSALRTFANAITCGETDCLQQECDIGIAEELHMLAIFTQQACSAAVMVWPGITHAANGCPKSTRATATAAI